MLRSFIAPRPAPNRLHAVAIVTHILIEVPKHTSDDARKLAADARAKIVAGADMGALAKQISDDTSAQTNGGRLDTTEDIFGILDEFKGDTVTYVNDRAFSAGAFIAVATKRIYMAPQSVIGAAAPVMMGPGGQVQDVPGTMDIKMKSAVRALVRRFAAKNGHNIAVVEAMIDKNKELKVDGQMLNEKGEILTLTDTEAAKTYGNPPTPLLSSV